MDFRYRADSQMSVDAAMSREWLETNGLGGYSSSTAFNCNTRKYHGLLVCDCDNLPSKYVLLNTIDDLFIHEGKENFLTAHSYPNFLQEGSFSSLQEFSFFTHPLWQFKFGEVVLTKEILMLHEENTVLIKYKVSGNNEKAKITLRPLIACREFHKLQHENSSVSQEAQNLSNGFSCKPNQEMPALYFQTNSKRDFSSQPLWYNNFLYQEEKERGYDFQEDLFSPGVISCQINAGGGEIILSCGLAEQSENLELKWQREIQRRIKSSSNARGNELQRQLHSVGQDFITKDASKSSHSIIAGYPWFVSWGRDTMISLPGLTLYSGQEDLCLDILKIYAQQEQDGLIPNYLGQTKETNAYNSVDAGLWFAWAVQQYYLKTNDLQAVVDNFLPTLKNIYTKYKEGALHNIKMRSDGLLFAGSKDVNLTWMDAVVNDEPVTPRYGLAVEVNALWFNMLSFIDQLSELTGDHSLGAELKPLLDRMAVNFCNTFWCWEKGYLYDFINDEEKNSCLRPNQLFAVSLPYSPLIMRMSVGVMTAVKDSLLTPYGLRTLAAQEEGYVGAYEGGQASRDLAYHNGTVWPWLLGHFAEGLLRTTQDQSKVLQTINPCIEALQAHLAEYGIGSIAEVFSGDHPHKPNGCISQAWSVAELLRLIYLLGFDK